MDTTEQLNGTYFFDGMSVDKEELLYWLLLDEFKKQFSDVIDLLAIASMLVSLPVIPVSGKLGAGAATRGTSPLSLGLRTLIRQRLIRAVEPSPGQNAYVASGHTQPV
nr:hypothetical protein [Enterobacter sichuanensis]